VKLGLRVDVDTYRGTKLGVPALCDILYQHDLRATFFFSVGPDNMGRHLWRLLRPAFLIKMLRTKAASLYGFDILLRGTFWPGPVIGEKCANEIRDAAEEGHEIGLHAWDHHAWQRNVERWDAATLFEQIRRGFERLTSITGEAPTCSAVAGWRCTEQALVEKAKFPFTYNSDCRGRSIFTPTVGDQRIAQPQIPVTLPTYDELIGTQGIDQHNYNDALLALLEPSGLNVLTIHAEVEGIVCQELFRDFLKKCATRNIEIVNLGSMLEGRTEFPDGTLKLEPMQGREGWVAQQR